MDNIKNLRDMEKAMEAHRAEMNEINRFFAAVYYICMLPSLVVIILGIAMIVVTLVTLGTVNLNITLTMVLKWFASIGAVFLFGMSNAKNKRCTVWSIAILLFLSLLVVIDRMIPLMYMIQTILQGLCLLKYERVDHLKCQLGYPDFNPSLFVSAVTDSSRRLTDSDVKAKLSQNRENKQETYMDEITPEIPSAEMPDTDLYITEREEADRKAAEIFREEEQ